jgi:RNA polymerase sigma-70 factor (ECF subfamily)
MGDNSNDCAQLVADHHEVLYRYAYRLTGSVPDAEDLTQQTFLVAQARLDQLRNTRSARGWLFAILRNAWIKDHRKRQPVLAASLELNMDNIPEEITPDLIDRERLQNALDELPDEFKAVVLLFYFEGCSYREIAEKLDLPAGTVMSRLSRAKSHLRVKLFEPAPLGRT